MGKKGKKSKKQLEDELQRVADEQKRHEEKERLLKLEKDTLQRHTERLEEELDSKEKVLEAERLEEESSIVTRMKGERRQNLEYEQSKLRDKTDWQKFISCTSRPNVAFENEITTYMTMAREEQMTKMEQAIRKCYESEETVGDLTELWCKAREDGDRTRQEWCTHYVTEIRKMEMEQMDEATAHLLQYIEKEETNAHSQVYLSWGEQNDDIKVGFWGHLQSKGFRAKQVDHPKIQIGLEMPKSIALQAMGHCIGVRTVYTKYDSIHGRDPSQMSVGGIIRVDLLSIPPFSKKVKSWTMRHVPPPGQELMRLPYPNTEHTTTTSAIALQPCKIEYKVPANVLVDKSPTISWWDATEERWSTDGISEISWEYETRKICFWSARLSAYSITQERHIDLPYKHWCMRPLAPHVVELRVQAARYEVIFHITEDGLRLVGPEEPELSAVMYVQGEQSHRAEDRGNRSNGFSNTGVSIGTNAGGGMGNRTPRVESPATLLRELRECGLSLMPEDADADQLEGYTPKAMETQARAYSDLSEIAAYYDIASSCHNKSLPRERALVRVRENPLYDAFDALDPDCDTDYKGIMFFPDKSCFVQSREQVSPCNQARETGHLTHASLYLCYDKVPNPGNNHMDQLHRLEVTCSNARVVEAIRQTMQLMRLLCFV